MSIVFIVVNSRTTSKEAKNKHQEYIESDLWKKRRATYFQEHPSKCVGCGETKKPLHLHHASYACLGTGEEVDEHLMPLCQKCHTKVHQEIQGNWRKLLDISYIVVNSMRREREVTTLVVPVDERCPHTPRHRQGRPKDNTLSREAMRLAAEKKAREKKQIANRYKNSERTRRRHDEKKNGYGKVR